MTSKRLDLQGIRGLAILSVLGFHFYTRFFPNGYLGVDQFFVLSGFLMCMLLTKAENMPVFSLLVHFYSRRFKRILPLYFLIILITVIALYTVFPDTALLQNETSAMKALFFVSNRPHTGEEDYFEKLSIAMDLFTHTWSLSVEIQFYFIVPFIFIIGNCFSNTIKYGYYLILVPKDVAFNSVFARIWQFLIGMVIYMANVKRTEHSSDIPYSIIESDKLKEGAAKLLDEDDFSESEDKEEKAEKVLQKNLSSLGPFSKYCFLVPMAYLVTYPIEIYPSFLRPIFTIFTGILMLLSIEDEYLSNRVLTYIGDISYSLYLIHWPIYAYCKLTYHGNVYVLTAGLVISIGMAILVFETFEKWYLKLSNVSITFLIISLLLTNAVLINKDKIIETINSSDNRNLERLDGVTPDMTVDDAIRLNRYWQSTDINGLKEPGCISRTPGKVWCDFEEKGKDFKLAIFGNSLTFNHHKMFLQECRHRAYNVTMYSEYGCEPLAALSNEAHCKRHLIDFVDFLKSAQPDYAFLFTRFFATGVPFVNNDTNLENDSTYKEMRNQMKQFTPNIKKKLFVLDAFPRTNNQYNLNVAPDLKAGKDIDEIHQKIVQPDTYKLARYRTEAIVKECGSKCELIDYEPLLFNNETNRFEFFDSRGFLYFTGVNHMSAHGMELVRPIYSKICKNLT